MGPVRLKDVQDAQRKIFITDVTQGSKNLHFKWLNFTKFGFLIAFFREFFIFGIPLRKVSL
jgi:hypothetical protein